MIDDTKLFLDTRKKMIRSMGESKKIQQTGLDFMRESGSFQYTYNFDWLGLPIIQFPQDILAIQEIIWKTKPDVIMETGIARGGSLILSASILHLLGGSGKVIGIDVDIRKHNRKAIESHTLAPRIQLVEASSTDHSTLEEINKYLNSTDKVLVILDSNHTHEHTLKELNLYSPFVKKGSYLIVMDSTIEDMPENHFPDRNWGKGNNPKTAVHEFLDNSNRFEIDYELQNKTIITSSIDGYLKCIS